MGTVVHATSDLRFQGFRRLSRRQGSRLRRAGRFSARIPSQLHDSVSPRDLPTRAVV